MGPSDPSASGSARADLLASVIGGASGKDAISIDRDLVAINARQAEQFGLPVIDYCLPPFLAQWQKQSAEGERAWLVRPRMGGGELVGRWTAEGFVSLAATHLGEVPAGADRDQARPTWPASSPATSPTPTSSDSQFHPS